MKMISHGLSRNRVYLMGIATIMVLICHISNLFPRFSPALKHITTRGNLGVDIFLLISGMGIFVSLDKSSKVMSFYQRRLKRILLPYVILATPYWLIRSMVKTPRLSKVMLGYSGLGFWIGKKNGAMWYVSFILVIYLLSPLVYGLLKKLDFNSRCFVSLLVAAVLLNMVLAQSCSKYYAKTEIAWSRIPIYILGLWYGACLKGKNGIAVKITGAVKWIYMTAIPVCYLLIILTTVGGKGSRLFLERITGSLFAVWLSLICCRLLDRLQETSRIKAFLGFMGGISFELYLTHAYAIHMVRHFVKPRIKDTVICLVLYLIFIAGCTVIAAFVRYACGANKKV
ncbi:MAG: acyltransferase [Eubacteriales bacterium]|nr:acyltransferase [Eubacteriales bacterium]